MKSLNLLILLFLAAGIAMFTSCEDDEFTEEDAKDAYEETLLLEDSLQYLRDSLQHVGGIIDYSVNVIDASNASFSDDDLKLAELTGSMEGTVVTVSQHGVTKTMTTDASGIATFKDLRIGLVSVNVQAENFTDASFTAKINPIDDPNVNDYYDVLRYSATMVPLFSLTENMATVEGKITLETDLTNQEPEIGAGIPIVATIDASHADFEAYLTQICDDCDQANGKITQIAYHQAQSTTSTGEDGTFSLQVPGTPQGLPVQIEVSEYATDQTLLLKEVQGEYVTGPQTIRTYFSSDFTVVGDISDIPDVPGAYVTFSAPNGSVSGAPDQTATADAHIGESGLMSVEINSPGYGYTQAPRLVVSEPTNPMGTQATVEANIVDGKISSVDITEQGSGYVGAPTIDIQTIEDGDFGEQAQASALVNFEVTDINVTNGGDKYESAPEVTITSNSGTGASAQALMGGYVSDVEVTSGGSDYVAPPMVSANAPADPNGTTAEFTADMSENNPLHSIIVEDNFNTTYETTPDITITSGSGSGATAVAQLESAGEITAINITNPGDGYDEAPTVNIIGGGGFGASAYATIDVNGSIDNIIVAENGQGYTSNPTIEISAPPAGGTQANAEAVRAFGLEAIILTNPGNGYNVAYTGAGDNYSNEPTVTIDGVNYTDGDSEITVRPAMDVEGVNVTNNGSGYQTMPTITFNAMYGEGSGAAATASMLYQVQDIEIITPGSGYEWNDANIVIAPPSDMSGLQAEANITLGNGTIADITLDNGGDGYTAAPTVMLTGGDEDVSAEVNAVVSNGEVIGFNITSGGSGYDNVVAVTIRTYHSHAILNTAVHQTAGIIENIEVTNPGSGYEIAPIVEFDNENTGGQGAEAVATIEGGRVSGIQITNPGSGYITAPDITLVVPNYLETAVGFPIVNNGRITGVDFTGPESFLTQGMGYEEQPTITFTPQIAGQGSGASAQADIANGTINGVIMLNQGSGYTARNYPTSAEPFAVYPTDDGVSNTFNAVANKSYIRDIYLGTGKRDPLAE